MKSILIIAVTLLIGAGMTTSLAEGEDWPQFCGASGTNVSSSKSLPIDWTKQVAWKVDLEGRGPSSPIVVGDKVFITTSNGPLQNRLHLTAFDAKTGKQLWDRNFWATGRCLTHNSSAVAAPTPASDGQHIYAFYSSNDLACFDLNGNLCWYRGLTLAYPQAGNDTGMASSPVVVDGVVVVQIECQGDSLAAGIDAKTGATLWRIDRPKNANWSSPLAIAGANGKQLVLLQSPTGLTAIDPKTGAKAWTFDGDCGAICSSVVANDVLFAPCAGVTSLRLPTATGEPSILWQDNRIAPGAASPIVYRDQIFAINNAGVLSCSDAKNGEPNWKLRLKGRYWATPVAAGNYLHLVNSDGVVQVVELGEKGTLAGECELGEGIQATPAASNDSLFVRSDKHLWRIGKP